jgi:UMF1 family MFS transporter
MIVAACVGLSMGAIQSLSRATFAALLPNNKKQVSSFSLFDMVEKLAIVTGTFSFALVGQLTQNLRLAILPVILFFIIGALVLYFGLIKSYKKNH